MVVHIDIAINPNTNRIYVAIPETKQIQIIDGFTDQVIKNITIGSFPSAITINPNTNKLYVISPETDIIYVIDESYKQDNWKNKSRTICRRYNS